MPRQIAAVASTLSLLLVPAAGATPGAAGPVAAPVATKLQPQSRRDYERTVQQVADMVNDERAYEVTSAHGLQLLNVLWEDTGRWEDSSVGPNISDVTIEVEGYRNGKTARTYLMPVMRHDNFTDKTADVKIDKILIPVGNHTKDGQLELVSLKDLLAAPARYLTTPGKGRIRGESLLAKRDTHVLVSAQHAFLPVPKAGKATFWPVIFNYQSTAKNPAVLSILVTRQGTSMTIIDNARDTVGGGGSWGQRLYVNQGGERAPLIAERLADVQASGVTANGEAARDLGEDANVLMLIQVPLRYREPRREQLAYPMAAKATTADGGPQPESVQASGAGRSRALRSDVDTAVLGHGPSEGPYTELDGLTIQRDSRFPVRVTLQFYQATSNGVISRANVKAMAAQIRKVYGKGDYVGSLVVPSGLDRQRPTNMTGVATAPDHIDESRFPGLAAWFHFTTPRPRVVAAP